MIKVLLAIIFLVLLEETAEVLYKHTKSYQNPGLTAYHLRGKIPGNLEIVNNGSGPAYYGINYKYTDKKGFNFGTPPQSFKNGFRLLKNFSEKILPNAIVIIVVMNPLNFGNNKDLLRPGYSDKFYGILPPSEIDNYSAWRALKLRHPFLQKVLGRVKRIFIRSHPEQPAQILETNEPGLIRGWKDEFDLKNLTDASQAQAHREAFAKEIQILVDEIDYCKSKNWRPVLVVPPVPECTRKYISDEFAKVFVYDNIQAVLDKRPGVKFLNYYDYPGFTDDMFNYGIFANNTGQEKFSKLLFSDVEKT